MTKYLHTMIRVSSLEDTIAFFEVLGLREIRRRPDEKGRYTNVFLAAPGDEAVLLSSTVRSVATAAKDACTLILSDFAAHGHPRSSAPHGLYRTLKHPNLGTSHRTLCCGPRKLLAP